MNAIEKQLETNLTEVREAIARAASRAGRDANDVQLIAVTKYAKWPWREALIDLGVDQLGESRPQQLLERDALLTPRQKPKVEWHLIGHLQRNKVRPLLPHVARIHSIDSGKLLDRIDRLAGEIGLRPKGLLEVNLSGEASKDGFSAEELEADWDHLRHRSHLQITGLMTMAPHTSNEDVVRGVFRRLRELRDRLAARSEGQWDLPELSMGMSGDFEIAIEEGATHIRLGSRLFAGCEAIHSQ